MSNWCVYLLYNSRTKRTYIGASTNVPRRLRQHNGEIRGGARSTRKGAGDWKLVCWLGGFETKSSAYRWEKLIKSRARGKVGRHSAFMQVGIFGNCPEYGKRKKYEVPKCVYYYSSSLSS
jgi:predicted GIY-YIG superfamily endonuclease